MKILVCSVSALDDTIAAHRASHVATLLSDELMIERPDAIAPENHLRLTMNDIVEPAPGYIAPTAEHVERLFEFVDGWDRSRPMVIHCWAGISRSTAAAYAALCRFNPDVREQHIASLLRRASPGATPNRLIVALSDAAMGREGRMVAAIENIGRGRSTWENAPFALPAEIAPQR